MYVSYRATVVRSKNIANFSDVAIFAVTPTYKRVTQKVDLTSLCYTIQYIPNLIWILIEDSSEKTSIVTNLLRQCKVSPSQAPLYPDQRISLC